MGITINTNLIVIIWVVLLCLYYFISNRAYKKGFDAGLKIGKMIGKSDAMSELQSLKGEKK